MTLLISGSSPRVRSGPHAMIVSLSTVGIISACAERSSAFAICTPSCWDHLRVCGAVADSISGRDHTPGSSPRVRSGRQHGTNGVKRLGIISACAERSGPVAPCLPCTPDHLRVCGAVVNDWNSTMRKPGSSPRVRSGRRPRWSASCCSGIISACAERSSPRSPSGSPRRDHLRVCGAVVVDSRAVQATAGSSPRVRSGQLYFIGIWSGWMVRNV